MQTQCPRCTYINTENIEKCELCEFVFEKDIISLLDYSPELNSDKKDLISCPRCTLKNEKFQSKCSACHYIIEKIETAVNYVSKSRAYCKLCKEFGHWMTSCQNKQSNDNVNSMDIIYQTYTEGIIELLREVLCRQKKEKEIYFKICSPLTFISQKGTEGENWSCGYRNIQMLCTSLLQIPSYRRVMFDQSGEVPSVHGLQSWIEKAWREGFDEEGANQLGELLGSSTWIGATECATLLRYFGIRAQVVDFGVEIGRIVSKNVCNHSKTLTVRPRGSVCDVCNYPIKFNGGSSNFCELCDYDVCLSCSSFISDYSNESSKKKTNLEKTKANAQTYTKTGLEVFNWLKSYFQLNWSKDFSHELEDCNHYLPPIYFQHDGHSRTIVGNIFISNYLLIDLLQ
jgi:hypothetical protein